MSQYGTNFRAPKVDVHQFAMIPRAEIPRSSFRMQTQHKTTFSASLLIPVYVQEVLPGDSFNVSMTSFVRLATPLVPLMDNIDLEAFFFFVPNRLVWQNWNKFCGEQLTPGDSISFTVPTCTSPASGFAQLSIFDYMGLPCTGQTAGGNTITVNALPLRAYGLIYNEWFRDENLATPYSFGAANVPGYAGMDNGPDPSTRFGLATVARRHDYFTSCLPWTQKGGAVVTPLTGQATVKTSASDLITSGVVPQMTLRNANSMGTFPANLTMLGISGAAGNVANFSSPAGVTNVLAMAPANLYADLSTASAVTINTLRLAFQTQKLLERDARGGTRYTEILRSHFGVISPDARLQRPELLNHNKTPINVVPVPQTMATGASGTTTPIGTLAAAGTGVQRSGFRQSFTEHGYILGLVCARADQGYQQGIRRMWSRSTRYDFFWPVFSAIGEQPVLNKEIFSDGSANDALTFGFQEAWADYRYMPSITSGYFRSTNSTPLDMWHVAIKYAGLPALNSNFVSDSLNTTLQRNLAAGASSANQQFLADFFFDQKVARPMPMYSVPGLIDHF